MKKYILITTLALIFLSISTASAVSTLYIDGVVQPPVRDFNNNATLSFFDGPQEWTLLAEYAAWKDKNNLGYYTESGNFSLIFPGSSSPIVSATTNISPGTDIGLWLHVDEDLDGRRDSNEPFITSQKDWHQTTGTPNDGYQYFFAYDVRAYRGSGVLFDFRTSNHDFSTFADYDYLVYIDDSGAGPDYDHNDMIVGVSAVPEPTTLVLIGLGLAGAGIFRKRKA